MLYSLYVKPSDGMETTTIYVMFREETDNCHYIYFYILTITLKNVFTYKKQGLAHHWGVYGWRSWDSRHSQASVGTAEGNEWPDSSVDIIPGDKNKNIERVHINTQP